MSVAVTQPVVDICDGPGGPRIRQLLLGDEVQVGAVRDGWAQVVAAKDGYTGWVDERALGDGFDATHRVAVLASHLYPAPDMKSGGETWVSFGSRLRVVSAEGAFFETHDGRFVPKPHLRPLNAPFADPATVAQMFFGVPYLWGGNSAMGIDCSGLVQAALLAAGTPCPGDSGPQERTLGAPLAEGAAPRRGDLLFWPGHVAMAVDGDTLIHANAHHMAVAYEPITAAVDRIEAQGDGPLSAHKRLT